MHPAPGAGCRRPAACAGDGAHAIGRHGTHVHLAYALQGGQPTEVREELRIAAEASYIVAVFAHRVSAASNALSRIVRDAAGRPPSAPLLEGIWH